MSTRQELINQPTRPNCTCSPELQTTRYHWAVCIQTAWDREHGHHAVRFVLADGISLSSPQVKRDGRWQDA